MAEKVLYNQKDIQRYLQGQMSKEEMYSFEKAMMDDPFLADALEGYQISDEQIATKHVSEIQASIKKEKEETKVVAFDTKRNNWWRIAALFILMAGSGIWAYNLLNLSPNNNSIAAKEAANTPSSVDSIQPAEAEKVPAKPELFPSEQLASNSKRTGSPIIIQEQPTASPVLPTAPVATERESIALLRSSAPVDTIGLSMATAAPADTKDRSEENLSLATNQSRLDKEMVARRMFLREEIRGKVVDDKGQPLANASIIANSNAATLTDANGNFTIRSADSVVGVSVASAGYAPANAFLKSRNTNNKIVLNQSNEPLAGVVVTEQKKLSGRAAGITTRKQSETPEPVIGWQKFNQYIDSALQNLKHSGEINSIGDVVLESKVDRKGNPFNIENINAANKALKEKAVEIIKKGPRWKPLPKNSKAKVVIRF